MKKRYVLVLCLLADLILLVSCTKEPEKEETETDFLTYTILAGNHSANESANQMLKGLSGISFQFRFDTTARYVTRNAENQADINKLYGFADCVDRNASYSIPPHHINSARLGWNWQDNLLNIYAYAYADSIRYYKKLRTVEVNKAYNASISVRSGWYIFNVDGLFDSLKRSCTENVINGYKLYPYFGGDETAPHDIRIHIKDK